MQSKEDRVCDSECWAIVALIAFVTLWRVAAADLLPITRDEAYYANWASVLAWGYFDHPPAVALLSLGATLTSDTLIARLGALLAGVASLVVLWRLYLASGLRSGSGLFLAVALASATLPGIAAGIITTPDTLIALFWPLALLEALRALQGQRKRWITAGLATGLGLLGKYTMALIGPVFLLAILRIDARALRTPWPYLGAVAALLVVSPNLLWNAHNDWVTIRFQFGHGFATDTGNLSMAADALPAVSGAHAYHPRPPDPMTPGERVASLGEFLLSQSAFWGVILIAILVQSLRRPCIAGVRARVVQLMSAPARALLGIAALLPLLFFAIVSLGSDVEANWAAMYVASAVPFIAILLQPVVGWALAAAATNLALAGVYAIHAATAFPPLPESAQRMLRESQGFEELAIRATALPGPVFADRYQYAAMLNYFEPELGVTQWPGITRPSEYGRGHIAPLPEPGELKGTGFWLFARKFSAPQIKGFENVSALSIYSCAGRPIKVVEGIAGWEAGGCDNPSNVWRLYRYIASRDGSAGEPTGVGD